MRWLVAFATAILTALALAAPTAAGANPGNGNGRPADTLLDSQIALDKEAGTITLPLMRGTHDGDTVWYIVTESSDEKDARRRGVNWAPKLDNALGTAAVQDGTKLRGRLDFAGTVDFSPTRVLVPGAEPNPFPPAQAEPGAIGDADYSPLVNYRGAVLNASQVANDSGVHDAVVDIDYRHREVTLDLLSGFYEGEEVLYLHQEATIGLVAALEGSTLAPNLAAAPTEGSNEDTSARSAIIPIVNGPRSADVGVDAAQGLNAALGGDLDSPNNITQSEPGEADYSPVWDLHPGVWTDQAIADGDRVEIEDHEVFAEAVADGLITGFGAGAVNDSLGGIQALGVISNCPIVFVGEI